MKPSRAPRCEAEIEPCKGCADFKRCPDCNGKGKEVLCEYCEDGECQVCGEND